jgi:hypothetical protein
VSISKTQLPTEREPECKIDPLRSSPITNDGMLDDVANDYRTLTVRDVSSFEGVLTS